MFKFNIFFRTCDIVRENISKYRLLFCFQDTSLPIGVFIWTVENLGLDSLEITIMLTFENGVGDSEASAGGHYNEEFICKGVYSEIKLEEKCKSYSSIYENKLFENEYDYRQMDLKNTFVNDSESSAPSREILDDTKTSNNEKASDAAYTIYKNVFDILIENANDNSSSSSSKLDSNTAEKKESNANDGRSTDLNNNILENTREESCVSHDVHGVLLHHNGLKKTFTIAVAALQVNEVI